MKLILILLMVLILSISAFGETPVGMDIGMLISKDAKPEIAYSLTTKIGVKSIVGPLVERVEISAVYSDRIWDKGTEIYAMRSYAVRSYSLSAYYVALGAGGWTFINTEGGDIAKPAFKTELGYAKGKFDAHIAGEIISFKGPDLYFIYGGLRIGI